MKEPYLKAVTEIKFHIAVSSENAELVAQQLKDIWDKYGITEGKLEVGKIDFIEPLGNIGDTISPNDFFNNE